MGARLGRISYLNTEPFFLSDRTRQLSIGAPPRQMLDLALSGAIDISPLPVVAYFDYPNRFRVLGPLGIACDGPARTVIFRSTVTITALPRGARVGIINETATSVRLLRVLLAHYYKVDHHLRFEELGHGQDAQLLIGDRALATDGPTPAYPYVIDLGAAWKDFTKHPFVFALWLARHDLGKNESTEAVNYFRKSLKVNLTDATAIHQRRPELNMTAAEIASYISNFEYELSKESLKGLDEFKRLDAGLEKEGHAA
jgi:chorismate dehydratase